MIATTIDQVRNAVPEGVRVGTCGFQLKAVGDMHKGHEDLVKTLKQNVDYVVANLWDTRGFYEILMGSPDLATDDPYQADLNYTADFILKAGADLVWLAPKSIAAEMLEGYNPEDLMAWAQAVCLKEKYIFNDIERTNNHYFYMITNMINQQKTFFPKHARAESIKDGLTSLYRKHFNEKYLGVQFIMVPATEEDGLQVSSKLKYIDADQKEVLRDIQKALKAMNAKASAKALSRTFMDKIIETISGKTDLGVDHIHTFEGPAIGTGKSLIEVKLHTRYNSNQIFSFYIDHEKGTIL